MENANYKYKENERHMLNFVRKHNQILLNSLFHTSYCHKSLVLMNNL